MDSFYNAAMTLGLIGNISEYQICLDEAIEVHRPPGDLRFLIVIFSRQGAPFRDLLEQYHDYLTSDLGDKSLFSEMAKIINHMNLPVPPFLTTDYLDMSQPINENFSGEVLNDLQKYVLNTIHDLLSSETKPYNLMFLQGRAGTGKTYTANVIINTLRGNGFKVLVTGTTGIVVSQYKQGMTCHSLLKLQIDQLTQNKDLVCNIGYGTQRAKEILEADLIIIDEISMLTINTADQINYTLRMLVFFQLSEIYQNNTIDFDSIPPFGGKMILSEISKEIKMSEALDFVNKINIKDIPPSRIDLLIGEPMCLMRNINTADGMVKNQRCYVVNRTPNSVIIEFEDKSTKTLPRINFEGETNGIKFIRHQVPLRPLYSGTIHKSQGMTLDRVVVDLRSDFWEHGQLYVALSRVRDPSKICILLPQNETENDDKIKPVSDKEIVDLVCSIENQNIQGINETDGYIQNLSQFSLSEETSPIEPNPLQMTSFDKLSYIEDDPALNGEHYNICSNESYQPEMEILNRARDDTNIAFNQQPQNINNQNNIQNLICDMNHSSIIMNPNLVTNENSNILSFTLSDLEELNKLLFSSNNFNPINFIQKKRKNQNYFKICDYEHLFVNNKNNDDMFQNFDDLYPKIRDIFHDNFQLYDIDNIQWKMNKFIGLKNFGHTCYLNSVIQVLSNSFYFRRCIWNIDFNCSIIESFKSIFYQLSFNRKIQNFIVQPYNLIQALNLENFINAPLDAHEILIKILNKFVDLKLFEPVSYFVLVSKIQTIHTTEINESTDISEYTFSITIDQKISSSVADEIMRLEDFSGFIDKNIFRISYFSHLPKILIVYINRTLYNSQTNQPEKNIICFKINDELNVLNKDTNIRLKHTLFATIVHVGESAENGHYVSLLRFLYNNNIVYFCFSDSHVNEISQNDFYDDSNGNLYNNSCATLAFYIQENDFPLIGRI